MELIAIIFVAAVPRSRRGQPASKSYAVAPS